MSKSKKSRNFPSTTSLDSAPAALAPLAAPPDPPSPETSAFCWPAPPYAIYRACVPWTEPQECELEGLNGAVKRCWLVALQPTERAISIQIENTKNPVTLTFAQFRRLTLKRPIVPRELLSNEEFVDILGYHASVEYHLELDNGSLVSGSTVGFVETSYGLFLYPALDELGSVKPVFLPHESYRHVTLGEHIGQLLVDQHTVTPSQVEIAASEQHALRERKLGDYLVDTAVVGTDQLLIALDQQAKMPMIRVGEALTRLGYIDEAQLKQALERQKVERSVPLGQLLVNLGFLTRRELNTALARKMGYPVVDVTQFPVEPEAVKKVPLSIAKRLNIMPLLLRHGMMVVAAADPTQRAMLEELEFLVQSRVVATLGDDQQIRQNLASTYEKLGLSDAQASEALVEYPDAEQEQSSSSELLESMELQDLGSDEFESEQPIAQSDNTLVRLINTMIIEAHSRGVSDIHIEIPPRKAKVRIRFRKDGVLSPYLELPHTYRAALVARLKIMSDLDISEKRKPQDGKIDFSKFSPHNRLELRVACIPTANGLEDVVMRLLSSAKPIKIDKLGLSQTNFAPLCKAIGRPYGMVLCVGPTGSGKTTTLHSLLGYLNTPERKIWTAEDPIEITQSGLRQVQVNAKIDWTFAKALRSFLRADPDVIMVGEIRDAETAQIAIEASLTGHLVLSTLHTNSAAETVTRLIDMGMDPFNFADSLLAVLAQRLARRWCPDCRTFESAPQAYLDELLDDYLHAYPQALRPTREDLLQQWQARHQEQGGLRLYSAPGCSRCLGSGMSGRVGLHELMCITPALRRLIQTGSRSEQIQIESFSGGQFRTLRQDGIDKVLAGVTSIEEVRANSNA